MDAATQIAPVETPQSDARSASLQAVLERAQKGSFVELVYALERTLDSSSAVGGKGPVQAEPVVFRHDPALSFSAGDISRAQARQARGEQTSQVALTTAFLGLTGAVSPLPSHFAEEVLQEDPDRPVRRDFLDMFHHRLIGVMYRGILSRRYPETFVLDGSDSTSRRLLCLTGALDVASVLPRAIRLRLAALLSVHGPSLEALEKALHIVLRELLGPLSLAVEPLAGDSMALPAKQRMRLGRTSRLISKTAVPLGSRVRCAGSKVRLRIGPVARSAYETLCAPRTLDLVRGVVEAVSRQALDCELVISLKPGEAEPFRLGGDSPKGVGRMSWLITSKSTPLHDVKISLSAQ